MNTPDNENGTWESEKGDEFERRVRNLHEAPLDLSSVKGTAMKIRTRRRAAVAGGILAAAAVLVPVAVIATTGNDRADGIDPAVPSVTVTDPATPQPTPAPTPAPTPPASPEQTGTPQVGAPVGVPYLERAGGETVLHRADGSTVTLPGTYRDAAVLDGPVVGYRTDDQGNGFVDVIDVVDGSSSSVSTTYAVRSAMSTTPDGRTVAFVTTDDELVVYNGERGAQTLRESVDPGVTLSAIVGNGDCVSEAGCHPFLEHVNFEEGAAFEINYEGEDSAPAPGALRVNDAGDDFLVSVITSGTDFETCGGLYDREGGGRWIFETCDYQVHEIAPDGQHTVAFDSYFDGLGPRSLYLLDGDGEEVASFTSDSVVSGVTWADSEHAVATTYQDGQWRIVSLGVDGELKTLETTEAGNELNAPWFLTGAS